jgi:hypothetical protein
VTGLPDYLPIIGAIILSVLAYFFGLRQAEQQRIIEERAKVISDLFKRYVDLEEQVNLLVEPIDLPGEPDRKTKYDNAAGSFNKLRAYHRRNTIWLSRRTAEPVDRFLVKYREYFKPFGPFREEEEVGRPDTAEEWLNVMRSFQEESPTLRAALEEEFRAALGDRRARLARLLRRSELEPAQRPGIEPPQSREDSP